MEFSIYIFHCLHEYTTISFRNCHCIVSANTAYVSRMLRRNDQYPKVRVLYQNSKLYVS